MYVIQWIFSSKPKAICEETLAKLKIKAGHLGIPKYQLTNS